MSILRVAASVGLVANMWSQSQTSEIKINEGGSAEIPGSTVTVQVVRVLDYTSQGCEGGPRGCPDQAEVVVTQGTNRRSMTLFVAHTPAQRQQNANKASSFGYDLVLTSVQGKAATLTLQASAAPAPKKGAPQKKGETPPKKK